MKAAKLAAISFLVYVGIVVTFEGIVPTHVLEAG